MIDLDGLEEHLKEIIDDGRGGERYTKAENVMALVQLLRQSEKDAARYRWLRDELAQSQGGIALFDSDSYVCDIDLFIDEAMQCK